MTILIIILCLIFLPQIVNSLILLGIGVWYVVSSKLFRHTMLGLIGIIVLKAYGNNESTSVILGSIGGSSLSMGFDNIREYFKNKSLKKEQNENCDASINI